MKISFLGQKRAYEIIVKTASRLSIHRINKLLDVAYAAHNVFSFLIWVFFDQNSLKFMAKIRHFMAWFYPRKTPSVI